MESEDRDHFDSQARDETPKTVRHSRTNSLMRPTYSRSAASSPNLSKLPPLLTQLPSRAAALQNDSTTDQQRPSTLHRITTTADRVDHSRPESRSFPLFHPSLSYAVVRDFAYPIDHPLHYGPLPDDPIEDLTPSSDYPGTRRMSDPTVLTSYPPNDPEDVESSYFLSRRRYGYEEEEEDDDDDLLDPAMISRHRKTQSNIVDYDTAPGFGSHRRRNHNEQYLSATPELQETDSPSQSASEGYDYDDDDYDSLDISDEEFRGRAVALFDFQRENENELPFKEGKVLWIDYRHGQGWLVGHDPQTRESGLIPEAYVRLVRDIEGGLQSLIGEAYNPDSPSVAAIDTPTERQILSSAGTHQFPHGLLQPLSTLANNQSASTSQTTTPTTARRSRIGDQRTSRSEMLGSDVFRQSELVTAPDTKS